MNKPYSKLIEEDLSKYLISYAKVRGCNTLYVYQFNIETANSNDRQLFLDVINKYKCWKIGKTSYKILYTTRATGLKDILDKKQAGGVRRSVVLDIPQENPFSEIELETVHDLYKDHMVDAVGYAGTFADIDKVYAQEMKDNFKQKEKEMNKKFKAVFSINIDVSDKSFRLVDPINPDNALEVVLVLNARLQFLKGQLDNLSDITKTDTDEVVNEVSVNKICEVVEVEIEEIQEMINYINENLE